MITTTTDDIIGGSDKSMPMAAVNGTVVKLA